MIVSTDKKKQGYIVKIVIDVVTIAKSDCNNYYVHGNDQSRL